MKTHNMVIGIFSLLLLTAACSAPKSWETQSSKSTVSIDLTPREIKDNKLVVDITVYTHSVNLSGVDLRTITVLTYNGYSVRPTSIPALSGHHTTGTLEFPIDNDQKSFTITIQNVSDISERTFKWTR